MQVSERLRAIYANAPLVCALLNAATLLHLACRTLDPPAWGLAYTALFPLAWMGWAVWRLSSQAGRGTWACARRVLLACVGLPAAVLLIPGVGWLRSYDRLKLVYEIAASLWLVFMAIHCRQRRGAWGFTLFFVAGAIYGMALENGGIQMGFFSEEGYRLYLRPLFPGPLVTGLGWCTVFYTVSFIVERITTDATPVWLRTALAACLALSIDLQVDPVATRVGWWVWHPSLPPAHHGVPLVNYISWVCAITPFAWHYFAMSAARYSDRKRALRTLIAVPAYLVAGAILVLGTTRVLCGPTSPAMRLFMNAITNGEAR